jgi:hypothetical protein
MRRPGLSLAVLVVLVAVLGTGTSTAAVAPPEPPMPPRPWLADAAPLPMERTDRTSYDMTATYDVRATIGWVSRAVRVDTTIDIVNTSGGPVSRLALNTIAAAIGQMRLGRVLVDGQRVRPRVRGQTILLALPAALAEGASTRVRVAYAGRAGLSTANHDWMWAQRNGVLNLYRFIPWLSRQMPFRRDNHGDPFVTPSSPEVRVALTSDRPLVYATSGERISTSGLTQTFVARDVRDFNITASPSYAVRSQRTRDGDTLVRVYTIHGRSELLMESALRSLRAYEAWIGPYPWPVFNVAESAGGFAMESPALIWMPMLAFTDADVRYITAHETGHQWFYGVVGNDQSTDMFADEALTDFISRTLVGQLRSSTCPRDRFDKPLYAYSGMCYFEVIYVQGSRWLDDLRKRMGDRSFWTAIRRYYADNQFGVSSNERLLEALRLVAGDWVLPRYRNRFPSLYGR